MSLLLAYCAALFRVLHDPEIKPVENMDKGAYMKNQVRVVSPFEIFFCVFAHPRARPPGHDREPFLREAAQAQVLDEECCWSATGRGQTPVHGDILGKVRLSLALLLSRFDVEIASSPSDLNLAACIVPLQQMFVFQR